MQDTLYRIIKLSIKDYEFGLVKHNLQVDYDKKLVPHYPEFFVKALEHYSEECHDFFKKILDNFYVFVFCLNKSNLYLPQEILKNINEYAQYEKIYSPKWILIRENILSFDNIKILSKIIDLTKVHIEYVVDVRVYTSSLIFIAMINKDNELIKFLFNHGFNYNDKYYYEYLDQEEIRQSIMTVQ
jgi:hypothetical protein